MDGEESPLRILIVGYGEIARQAHLPALQLRSDSLIVGLVDTIFSEEEVAHNDHVSDGSPSPLKFASVRDACRYFGGSIHAVSICTPKTVTLSVAWDVLKIATSNNEWKLLGILLEKPPGDNIDDLKRLVQYARSHGTSIFTACHTTVCPARKIIDAWLLCADAPAAQAECNNNVPMTMVPNKIYNRRLESVHITWKESVRKWHPGQTWISKESGGGVTDILFNPLSLIVSLFSLSLSTTLKCDLDKEISIESTDQSRTISLISADLVRPCNWEAPISGCAELLMYVPLNDNAKGTTADIEVIEVPITADFAFDYEPFPDSCKEEEEIWNIKFVESVSEINESTSNQRCLTLKDGGAQVYIGSQKVTTEPTAEYPLLPEYEALYDQFIGLIRMNLSESSKFAPSIVDRTTSALLKEITRVGDYNVGPPYDF